MIRLMLLVALLTPMAQAQQRLASYVGQKRVLLIFAPSDQNVLYQRQIAALAHHAQEIKDRDLVILPVVTQEGPPINADTLRVTLGPGMPPMQQLIARRRFGIADQAFAVVLVGKDGGDKFRSDQPVTMDHLDRIIDAMPMRQEEMRSRSSGQ